MHAPTPPKLEFFTYETLHTTSNRVLNEATTNENFTYKSVLCEFLTGINGYIVWIGGGRQSVGVVRAHPLKRREGILEMGNSEFEITDLMSHGRRISFNVTIVSQAY